MKKAVLTPLWQAAIIAFCVWHMAAVALYSIPDRATADVFVWLRDNVNPILTPYLLATSQWQNWGMFSERSVSRVVTHNVEVWRDGKWRPLAYLAFVDLPWWENEPETDLLRSIESDGMRPIRERYLLEICSQRSLPAGSYIRFSYRYFDMPLVDDRPLTLQEWMAWYPEWQTSPDNAVVRCPGPSKP